MEITFFPSVNSLQVNQKRQNWFARTFVMLNIFTLISSQILLKSSQWIFPTPRLCCSKQDRKNVCLKRLFKTQHKGVIWHRILHFKTNLCVGLLKEKNSLFAIFFINIANFMVVEIFKFLNVWVAIDERKLLQFSLLNELIWSLF